MKNLREYIYESIENNSPKSKRELQNIIKKLLKERKDQDVIDLNDIDTSNITDMSGLFYELDRDNYLYEDCKIDISNWDVSNVTDMSHMFYYCENLESIGDISNWDVSKVKDFTRMFESTKFSCGDLNKWHVELKQGKYYMFSKCNIKIPRWYYYR